MEKYKDLTEEKIRQVIEEVMYKPDGTPAFFPTVRPLPENFDLDFQIQDGYAYMLSSDGDNLTLMTGSGGIRDYITTMREAGAGDDYIASSIFVTDYTGKETNQWHSIIDIKWKPRE